MAAKTSSQANELVEKLAKAPPKVKAAVFGGAALLVGLLYWYFFYSDIQAEKTSLGINAQNLAKTQKQLTDQQKEYKRLVDDKKRVQKEIDDNRKKFPAAAEVPAFVRYMQAQAIAANVERKKWDLETEMPVESYMRVPMSIEVSGTYFDLVRFFKLLRDMDRIISVENLSIGNIRREGSREVLTAKFRASTFRQGDAAAAAPAGAPKPPAPGPPPPPAGKK